MMFDISLILEKGTSLSNFDKEVIEYHKGIGWTLSVQSSKEHGFIIWIFCQEGVGRKCETSWNVVADAEFTMDLASQQIPIATLPLEHGHESTEVILNEKLTEKLKAHIVHSEAIVTVRVKILRTFGCRRETLENFDEPKPFWTDQCLIIGERKFHVNKKFLAHKSPIFKELFKNNVFKKLASCWKTNDITIDNTNPVTFEIFLQVVHKKLPAFPVQLVPELIELAKRFKTGPVREYCEWYLHQCNRSIWENSFKVVDQETMNKIMKQAFPKYEPITDTDSGYEMARRPNELYLSTMEENYRKPETFVITLEMVEFCKGCCEEKKYEHYGLLWTASVVSDQEEYSCFLKCDELYRLDWGDPNYAPEIRGWCVIVDIKVFAWFEKEKILVGSENNVVYDEMLELVEVELSDEYDWSSMSAGDVRFEIHVEIVKASATRHLSLEDFSKKKKGWTDVCLVAGGRQFHVNKKTLAHSSEVFADIFNKKPGSVAGQLQLDEDDPEAFHMFLQLSHGSSTFIEDKDIPGMIALAKKYKSESVMYACTQSILNYTHNLPEQVIHILNQLDCPLLWETMVQDWNAVEDISADSVTDLGLTCLFRRLVKYENIEKLKRYGEVCTSTVEKCPDSMHIPTVFQGLIKGTNTSLSTELRTDFEQFLFKSPKLGVKKRLLLADKYDFHELIKKCLSEISGNDELTQFIDCYATLTRSVKLALLRKVTGMRRHYFF